MAKNWKRTRKRLKAKWARRKISIRARAKHRQVRRKLRMARRRVKESEMANIEFLFVLKPFVRLPARPYFRPAIATATPKINAELAGILPRAIERMKS